MSKAILVMDMPSNCQKCPCMYGGICFAKDKAGNPDDIDPVMTIEESHEGRPVWCPLKETDVSKEFIEQAID